VPALPAVRESAVPRIVSPSPREGRPLPDAAFASPPPAEPAAGSSGAGTSKPAESPSTAPAQQRQADVPARGAGSSELGSDASTPAQFDAAYLNNPKPEYPRMARRLGEEGTVLLRVFVSAQGAPETIELHRSSGSPRLDRAARETVRSWKFVPARKGERPVGAWVLVPITFVLQG
jgi:protein TonB